MAKGQTEYTQTQREMIKFAAKQHTLKLNKYSQGLKDMFMTIKGQCTENMKQILSGMVNFASAEKMFDTLKFMWIIQHIAYNHRANQYQLYAIMMATRTAFLTQQGEETSNADWYKQFKNTVIVAEALGGSFLFPKMCQLVQNKQYPGIQLEKLTEVQKMNVNIISRELLLPTLFIMN